jgi:hypothetical protein
MTLFLFLRLAKTGEVQTREELIFVRCTGEILSLLALAIGLPFMAAFTRVAAYAASMVSSGSSTRR